MTQQFENMKPNDHRWRLFMQNSSHLSIMAPNQSRRKETQARPTAILLCIPSQSQHNWSSVNFKLLKSWSLLWLLPSLPVNTANFKFSLKKTKTIEVARKQQNWHIMALRNSAAITSLMLLCIFKTHAVQIMEVQVPSTVEVSSPAWLLLCFLLVSLF